MKPEYEIRLAGTDEAATVWSIASETIGSVYPAFYPDEAVRFFAAHHSLEAVEADVAAGKVWLLRVQGKAVGTGTGIEDHITRVFVLPSWQGRGYGNALMEFLEQRVFERYGEAKLDASAAAEALYEKRGYRKQTRESIPLEHGRKLAYWTMTKRRPPIPVTPVLEKLDELYGVTKEGFLHREKWQLLAAIMLSAQSTDKQVEEVLPALFERFGRAEEMAGADVEEIEGYIRSVGLYKSKAAHLKECCRQIAQEYRGEVPDTLSGLLRLSGVGRKTATLFLADAYGVPGVTVDTHVFRVSKRLGWAEGKNPAQVEKELQALLPVEHWNRINFQLIYLGRSVCTARKAYCGRCPLSAWCGSAGRAAVSEPERIQKEA